MSNTIFNFADWVQRDRRIKKKPIVLDRHSVIAQGANGEAVRIEAQDSYEFTYQHGMELCWICSDPFHYKVRELNLYLVAWTGSTTGFEIIGPDDFMGLYYYMDYAWIKPEEDMDRNIFVFIEDNVGSRVYGIYSSLEKAEERLINIQK